jgi:hypothetical protein
MARQRPDRPVFSQGQTIGAADLNTVVDYARDEQRRLGLSTLAWGIGVGLDLIERPAQGGGVELWIEPGIAWDGYNRAAVVMAPALVSPDLFAGLSDNIYPVWLRYDEMQVPVNSTAGQCYGGSESQSESGARVQESFAIVVGRKLQITDRQSGITIAGATVVDARDMLRAVNQNAAVVLDAAAPHQAYPDDASKPLWLIPVGIAAWQSGQLVARTPEQILLSRAARRYVGAIAETVLAADGVLRLRDRQTALPSGLTEDQLEQNTAIQDVDLQIETSTGRCIGNELVWVEGNMRVTGDARMFGTKLELRASDGSEAGGAPLFARRSNTVNDKGGQDLQIAIGTKTDGTDRLTIGPIDPSTDTLHENVIVRSDGEVCMAGDVAVGFTSPPPRTALEVQGTISGDPSVITNHVAIIENLATLPASTLALQINAPANADGQSNFITFFNNGAAIGSIKATGFTASASAHLTVAQPDSTQNDPAVLSKSNAITMVTNSADFAECLRRVPGTDPIGPGRIVGAFAGCISLVTEGADSLLITTDRPAVLGNAPTTDEAGMFEAVALVGQVTVLVEGAVRAGDFIVPSGRADGVGRAVAPTALTPAELTQIVGRAWENSEHATLKRVNTIVGAGGHPAHGVAAMLAAQNETIRALYAELAQLKRTLDS